MGYSWWHCCSVGNVMTVVRQLCKHKCHFYVETINPALLLSGFSFLQALCWWHILMRQMAFWQLSIVLYVCLLSRAWIAVVSNFYPPPLKKTLHCYQLYVTPASYAGVPQLQSRPGDPTVFWWYSLVSPGTCRNITSYWPRPLYSTSFLVHCSLA
jgi:hypothetical protein